MTLENWRCSWVTEKCKIASALARGEAGGSYSEAAILVCATLNALAAEVWPGRGLDRVRFIELLVRFGYSPSLPMTISVPLLIQHLKTTASTEEATLLTKTLLDFSPSRVITGLEVDKMEGELVSICPKVSSTTMRKFSYACLLYEEIRSSYAHEYTTGDKADSWAMAMSTDQPVSYVNHLRVTGAPEIGRLIHFHIAWLTKIAIDLASSLDALGDTLPRQRPASWWIDGAP